MERKRLMSIQTIDNKVLNEISQGYKNLSSKDIVVCVACRDVGNQIYPLLHTIEKLKTLCGNLAVVFFENDSIDNTVGLLTDWCERNTYGELISETLNFAKFGSTRDRQRVENLAVVRNRLLGVVKEKYNTYDYVMMVDADLQPIPIDNIAHTFNYTDWDAISANGLWKIHGHTIYYDIWALVEEGAKLHYRSVHRPFKPHTGLIKVNGGFGGLVFYRICPEFLKCHYYIVDFEGPQHPDNKFSVEHTGLHFDMLKYGLDKIYINTSMVVLR